MILVAYAKIPPLADVAKLSTRVRRSFSRSENTAYFDSILSKNNVEAVKESLSALLLLAFLSKRLGLDTSMLVLKKSVGGKPFYDGDPAFFSLSHSKGYAAAAVSTLGNIGIDIECAEITGNKAEKLAKRFFCMDDAESVGSDADRFSRLWTKKEALAKMHGTALSDVISKKQKEVSADHEDMFFAYFCAAGHPLTICYEQEDAQIEFSEAELWDIC